jgi:hypothetical protein
MKSQPDWSDKEKGVRRRLQRLTRAELLDALTLALSDITHRETDAVVDMVKANWRRTGKVLPVEMAAAVIMRRSTRKFPRLFAALRGRRARGAAGTDT